MDKLVSIIVPVYNVEKYLAECIESIINQTYRNIEILLINDGSKDNSISVCYEYAQKDNRIIVINKDNEGASITRNLGIEKAQGEYIMFVDSDDWIDKQMIEKCVEKANDGDYDLIVSKLQLYSNDNITKTYCYYQEDLIVNEKIRDELITAIFLDNRDSKFSYIEGPVCKFIKKELILKNEIYFNPKLVYGEDATVSLELYIKAPKIFFLNQYLYTYRQNETSVTHRFDENFIKNFLNTSEYVDDILKKNELYEKYKMIVYYNRIKQIGKIMDLYFFHKNNTKSYQDSKKEFKELIHQKLIEESILHIDIKMLHLSRKILVFGLKNELYWFLKMYYKLLNIVYQ